MRSEYVPEWKAILQECSFPTDVVVIDFESYFDADYHMSRGSGDGLSTIEYVTDPRFEEIGCGFLRVHQPFPNYEGDTRFIVGEEAVATYLKWLQSLYGENLSGCTVVIHNASFDALVLLRKHGINPPHVIDTTALARHWNARDKADLDTLCKRHKLPEKGDTAEFKGMTFRTRYTKPKKGRAKGPKMPVKTPAPSDDLIKKLCEYGSNDVCREWELFTLLLPRLSNPKTELRIMRHTLDLWLKPSIKVDFEQGAKLVEQMEAELDRVVSEVCIPEFDAATNAHVMRPITRDEVGGDNSFEWILKGALEAAGDSIAPYTKVGKKKMLLAIAKDDHQRKLLVDHRDEVVRKLMAARIANDSWPTHIKRVNRIMRQAKAAGGWLCVPLKYCGAHTGRWSGGEGINLQNLGNRGHELVNAVRFMLIAPDGETFLITDASQIEARVLAWIAGQWDLVAKFANNEEIYCGFASQVLGVPIRKAKKKGGIPAVEARMTWARNSIGKVGVLGCGYGMGTDRIFEYAKGAIDIDTAEKIKVTYRESNGQIVTFWGDIEKAFKYTAKYGKPCEMPRGLKFHQTADCDVIITLPNGRELKYVNVKLVPDKWGEKIEVYNAKEHHWEHVWGGHLTENVVQAMSRDILIEAILRCEDRGIHTALHVHDEMVAPVPIAQGEQALKISIEEMSRRPSWATDCPLGAEGVLSTKYGKH